MHTIITIFKDLHSTVADCTNINDYYVTPLEGLIDPKGGEGMYLAPGKLQIHRLKIVKSRLSVHSTNAVQTAAVSIISYKPLSDLNFARDTIMYGSYMPSPSLRSISPW